VPGRRPRVAGRPRTPAPAVQQPEPAPAPTVTPSPGEGVGLLVVGRIGKPQGIRGEVTVEVRTDAPDDRFADAALLVTDPPERGPLRVASRRDQNGRLVVLFEGVPDRNAAEALRDTLLLVDAATLPAPDDPDEFHDFQLVGLAADLADGRRLGVLTEVLHLPHGDVLVVRRDEPDAGSPEVLVPFVAAMVPVVDVAGGRVVLELPDGLLDLGGDGPGDDEPAGDVVDDGRSHPGDQRG